MPADGVEPGGARRPVAPFLVMLGLGFASGLPYPLASATLRYWLSFSGASLWMIGLTANLGLVYVLKAAWSPMLDRAPPGFLARLGRRRGWLAAIQPLLVAGCAALALTDPAVSPGATLGAALLVAVLSASQDVVIDAWRVERFGGHRQGPALAVAAWGYRAAFQIAGAGVIWASARIGWRPALLVVSALGAVGMAATALAREPARQAAPPRTLRQSVVLPLIDLASRPGAGWVLGFVLLFNLGETVAGVMTAPFYRALGFDRDQIAAALFDCSLPGNLIGVAAGAALAARFGNGRALLATGAFQTVSMAAYLWLAASPGRSDVLYATVALEAFAQATAYAAFLAFLSSLCSARFAATQYAVLSALATLGLHTLGGASGWLAARLGWRDFYTATLFAAVPAMILMVILLRRGLVPAAA